MAHERSPRNLDYFGTYPATLKDLGLDPVYKKDAKEIEAIWSAVGGNISQALSEVAESIGGEELKDRVLTLASEGDLIPYPTAITLLERLQPGSAELVLLRASEIQQEIHAREIAELNSLKTRFKKLGQPIARVLKGNT